MATKKKKKKRLGMGLSGMLTTPVPVEPPVADSPPAAEGAPHGVEVGTSRVAVSETSGGPLTGGSQADDGGDGVLMHLSVTAIEPNAKQPRQRFDQASLDSLAASISASGLMQPVMVRPAGVGGLYELVAGERRWRAAQQAGLTSIPCLVREVDDQAAAELGLIENLQREDLDAIELAEAFEALQAEYGLTHQEIADRVGWSRAAVTNQLRLTALESDLRALVQSGALSGGHARMLLSITDSKARLKMAKQAIEQGWSVREIERRVREAAYGTSSSTKSSKIKPTARRAHLDDLENQLSDHLGTRVRITANKAGYKGAVRIEFYDLDQFDGLLQRMGFKPS